MSKEWIKYISCTIGLACFGVIVAEILKKWQLVSPDLNPLWVVAAILLLFATKEFVFSSYIKDNWNVSPEIFTLSRKAVNVIWVILAILTLLSVPFIWFGTIEELAGKAHIGRY